MKPVAWTHTQAQTHSDRANLTRLLLIDLIKLNISYSSMSELIVIGVINESIVCASTGDVLRIDNIAVLAARTWWQVSARDIDPCSVELVEHFLLIDDIEHQAPDSSRRCSVCFAWLPLWSRVPVLLAWSACLCVCRALTDLLELHCANKLKWTNRFAIVMMAVRATGMCCGEAIWNISIISSIRPRNFGTLSVPWRGAICAYRLLKCVYAIK